MKRSQKMGGIAAIYQAAAYVAGMVFFLLVMDYTGVVDPVQRVALLADNQLSLYIMNLVIYVVFGIFLVVLTLALHERLKTNAPSLMRTATAFGLIWAGLVIASGMVANIGTGVVVDLYETDPTQAAMIWLAIDTIVEGIGGGNEIVGGLWVLLVSWAALQTDGLPRVLNYLGLVIGLAGIVSAIPAFGDLGGIIFGLGQIVWFVWLGFVLLLSKTQATTQHPDLLVPHHSTGN
ncbi:MAG: DUF4386 family protein [Chloroflexota bacterium]